MPSPRWACPTWSSPPWTATTWPTGGAAHFAQTIRAIRARAPGTTIEVLTPDFIRSTPEALETVVAARPDVFNHNLETVPGLYPEVRPGARYFHSLRLLQRVKELDPAMFTKSGIMVGLGEERQAVIQVMDDMRAAGVDFLTIGQYLQPTPKHHAVARYVTPEEFAAYERAARGKGFGMVLGQPADAVELPRGRGLRPAQGGADGPGGLGRHGDADWPFSRPASRANPSASRSPRGAIRCRS